MSVHGAEAEVSVERPPGSISDVRFETLLFNFFDYRGWPAFPKRGRNHHGVVSSKSFQFFRIYGTLGRELPNYHIPSARGLFDRRAGVGSVVPVRHDRHAFGCTDVRNGRRYVDVSNVG